ncbi:MAG TPA: intein-containing RctB family protein [Gemmataceae bacterium]|nr:intein-containing RctB family protein [Gemmataceae bacterium]
MGKDIYRGPLEKVNDTCWRIPKSYKPGMRVDGLIFADENLLDQIKKDQAPDQVANVAFLPGIQHASLAMPDIHWGYGFCIGGVCATDPNEGGVISPGGVGYDVNCLAGQARVLHAHGYTRRIDELAQSWPTAELSCFNLQNAKRETTEVRYWFAQKPRAEVYRLTTDTGHEVCATADHPFWTPDGMVALAHLQAGNRVAVAPFEGVPYEEPSNATVVSEADFAAQWRHLVKTTGGNGLTQVIHFLKAHGLLPLRYNSPAVPFLCKLLGFVFGDGNLHFTTSGKGVTMFFGSAPDLETIRADILRLGLTPSRVYTGQRQHRISTAYAERQFERTEEWFKVVGSGLALLLACLGAPVGNKARQDYEAPAWLEQAPRWHKRLFLAAFFGAELTTPATIPGHGSVFGAPTIGMNKRLPYAASGRRFLEQLGTWVGEFGVRVQGLYEECDWQTNKAGEGTIRCRLALSGQVDTLIALWSRIGYEYNAKRSALAALAVQYLRAKQQWLDNRKGADAEARRLAAQGVKRQTIVRQLAGPGVSTRFIARSLDSHRPRTPRISNAFPTFRVFCETAAVGRSAPMVWDTVARIEAMPDFDDNVYDFTVAHEDHNFVANGFVVSNCGVRLVRSNLYYREIKPHLRTLVEELFRKVPTGTGQSGHYRFNQKDLKTLLNEGARYVVEQDLGTASDLENAEASGHLEGADAGAVSERALTRGADQCGTLGSGNHFLEVQVVDQVFDEEVAGVLGLEKDMICVMIHSGSRGLGYQVCDDALAMLRKAPEKYRIELPDRQLACAPVNSTEGEHYIAAMRAAANFAWCNRQLLMHQAREVFEKVFGRRWQTLQMNLVYDVCHNIAKLEEHTVDGKKKRVWVHRKGATRAFPPGHPEVPARYRKVGQPVIIPGDMGRASWVLIGQPGSMEQTFGTTCHGAGRAMSRTAAVKEAGGRRIDKELEARGVIARARSHRGLAEEQPKAYKNVDDVVEVVDRAGLSRKVARMRPIGVIKG